MQQTLCNIPYLLISVVLKMDNFRKFRISEVHLGFYETSVMEIFWEYD